MTWWRLGSVHLLLLLAAGCVVGVTALDVASRFGGPLVVPLQIPDRYRADDDIVSGQVAERGALVVRTVAAARPFDGLNPLRLALLAGAVLLGGLVASGRAPARPGRPRRSRRDDLGRTARRHND